MTSVHPLTDVQQVPQIPKGIVQKGQLIGKHTGILVYLFQQRERQICCCLLPQVVTFCQTWGKLKAAKAEATTNVAVVFCMSPSLVESASSSSMEAVMTPLPGIPCLSSKAEMAQQEE